MTRSGAVALSLLLPAALLTACGDDGGSAAADEGDRLVVRASFAPLQEAVQHVGGDHVEVDSLTPPGAEPHDVELSPKDVLSLKEADSVVYLSGFQPAVDDAIGEAKAPFDVASSARLDLEATDDGHGHGHEDEHEEHGTTDPHFWLDPTRYADVVTAIGEHLAELDPGHASDYRANAKAYTGELSTLDEDMTAGLASCRHRDLITSHAAFGYLAEAYDLHQEGISGLSPESEPSAAEMAELVEHIKEHGVSTIYAETLVPRDIADTLAKDADVEVAVLDPIEGFTDESAAQDYLGVMRANLATLRSGQECT